MKKVLTLSALVLSPASPSLAQTSEWYSPYHSPSGDASYVCDREKNPAEFARMQEVIHTVEMHDVVDSTTGKVIQSTLVISGISDPFVLYRGLERCQSVLPALEAAEVARRAKRHAEDAKYQ